MENKYKKKIVKIEDKFHEKITKLKGKNESISQEFHLKQMECDKLVARLEEKNKEKNPDINE